MENQLQLGGPSTGDSGRRSCISCRSDDLSVYRAGVEALVKEACPDRHNDVDDMMAAYEGREEELLGQLSAMLVERRNRENGSGSDTEDEDIVNGDGQLTRDTSEYTFETGPSGYDLSTLTSTTGFDMSRDMSALTTLTGFGASASSVAPPPNPAPALAAAVAGATDANSSEEQTSNNKPPPPTRRLSAGPSSGGEPSARPLSPSARATPHLPSQNDKPVDGRQKNHKNTQGEKSAKAPSSSRPLSLIMENQLQLGDLSTGDSLSGRRSRVSCRSDDLSVYRAGVEALVKEACPDRHGEIDDMMAEYEGREEALLGQLSSMLAERRNRENGSGSDTEDEDIKDGQGRLTRDASEYTFETGTSGYDLSTLTSTPGFDMSRDMSALTTLTGFGASASSIAPPPNPAPASAVEASASDANDSEEQATDNGPSAPSRRPLVGPSPGEGASARPSPSAGAAPHLPLQNDKPADGRQKTHKTAQGPNSVSQRKDTQSHCSPPMYTSPVWAGGGLQSDGDSDGSMPSQRPPWMKPSKKVICIGAITAGFIALVTGLSFILRPESESQLRNNGASSNAPSSSPTMTSPPKDCRWVNVEMLFDDYSGEISYNIEKISSAGDILLESFEAEQGLSSLKQPYCLEEGQYRFTVYDKASDGQSDGKQKGRYNVTLDGESLVGGMDFEKKEETIFRIPAKACERLNVNIVFDDYSGEIAWGILMFGPSAEDDTVIATYDVEDGQKNISKSYCLREGKYRFTITDRAGDGLCCERGRDRGYYNVTLSGEVVIQGGDFGFVETATFVVDPIKSPNY